MSMPEEQSAAVGHYLRDSACQEVRIAVCGLKGVGKVSLLRRVRMTPPGLSIAG